MRVKSLERKRIMANKENIPKGLKENPGVLGDELGDNAVLNHDVVKARCSRFFTKLLINHSPKTIGEYFFEMMYELNSTESKSKKRLDAFIRDFDTKWNWETNSKEKEE